MIPDIPDPSYPDNSHLGWYRGWNLPHADHADSLQSITYHLADSLPAEALARLEFETGSLPATSRDMERRKRLEDLLDAGYGCCCLRHPEAARLVIGALKHFHGTRYRLLFWVVMPNHVHVLIDVLPGSKLGTIVRSWKNYTARRIVKLEFDVPRGARPGDPVWFRDYWDRFIRDEAHFHSAVNYIHENPVKAGLVRRAEDWPWSSASRR